MSTEQPRTPAGSPDGGQFTGTAGAENATDSLQPARPGPDPLRHVELGRRDTLAPHVEAAFVRAEPPSREDLVAAASEVVVFHIDGECGTCNAGSPCTELDTSMGLLDMDDDMREVETRVQGVARELETLPTTEPTPVTGHDVDDDGLSLDELARMYADRGAEWRTWYLGERLRGILGTPTELS